MIIEKNYRIENAVSTEANRESMQNIWVTKRHAFASDGKILAAVPVTSEKDDTTGWLTPKALKLARRGSKSSDTITISLNGQMVLPGGVMLPRPTENRFPRVFHLFRRAFTGKHMRIGLNADNLKSLSRAIGTEEIVLEFSKADEAILIRPLDRSNTACGLLMPIRLK